MNKSKKKENASSLKFWLPYTWILSPRLFCDHPQNNLGYIWIGVTVPHCGLWDWSSFFSLWGTVVSFPNINFNTDSTVPDACRLEPNSKSCRNHILHSFKLKQWNLWVIIFGRNPSSLKISLISFLVSKISLLVCFLTNVFKFILHSFSLDCSRLLISVSIDIFTKGLNK